MTTETTAPRSYNDDRRRWLLVVELAKDVAGRVRNGFSVADAIETVRCGRTDVPNEAWVDVEILACAHPNLGQHQTQASNEPNEEPKG